MSFERFLFDKPHFIREMLVWICCWITVFKINGIEEASQRHLANNAAANKIVVRLNFRRDGSGKVRYLNFWTWQRSWPVLSKPDALIGHGSYVTPCQTTGCISSFVPAWKNSFPEVVFDISSTNNSMSAEGDKL